MVFKSSILNSGGSGGASLGLDVIIVDQGGEGDFTTIAAALATASSGDVIYIAPGTYSENTLIIPNGVDIWGASRGTVKIGGSFNNRIMLPQSNNNIFSVQVINTLNLTNANCFGVSGSGGSSLGATNVYVYDCILRGSHDMAAIQDQTATNWHFFGNSITDTEFDIFSSNAASVYIYSNTCICTPTEPSEVSFLFFAGGTAHVFDNEVFISRAANESSVSFIRTQGNPSFDPSLLYSKNNQAFINAGTSIAYGFRFNATDYNLNAFSDSDSITITGNASSFLVEDTGTGDAVGNFYISGGNLTTFNLNGGINVYYPALSARPYKVRVVTAAGAVTATVGDQVVMLNKTVGAATTVTLPTAPSDGFPLIIKDEKGDAATNNITLTPGGSDTIQGGATSVMNVNYQSRTIIYNATNTNWSIN